MHSTHTPPPPAYLPKIHSNPILPYTPRPSKWPLSFGLSHQNRVHTCPAHLILLDLICLIISGGHTCNYFNEVFWTFISGLSQSRISVTQTTLTDPRLSPNLENSLLSTYFTKKRLVIFFRQTRLDQFKFSTCVTFQHIPSQSIPLPTWMPDQYTVCTYELLRELNQTAKWLRTNNTFWIQLSALRMVIRYIRKHSVLSRKTWRKQTSSET
jgi:hypothetical protein